MFTLLKKEAATDIKEFLLKFKDTLITDGWTQNYYGTNDFSGITESTGDKLVMTKGGNTYYFAAGIQEDVFGEQRSSWETYFEGITVYYRDSYIDEEYGKDFYFSGTPINSVSGYSVTNGVIENFWIYKNDDDGYLVVFEYEVGVYSQMYFGGVKMFDQNRTIAQAWSCNNAGFRYYNIDGLNEGHRALFCDDTHQRSSLFYNGFYYNINTYNNPATIETLSVNIDGFIGTKGTVNGRDYFPHIQITTSSGVDIRGDRSMMARTKVKFNDKHFPIATKVWARIESVNGEMFCPFFEIDGYYSINFETIQPQEVLAFGTKQFICFPYYQKNNPQDYYNDERGRGLGFSLKIAD